MQLTIHDLTIGYSTGHQTTAILSHLNLSLKQGRLTALLGRNGAGKSTLLRTITSASQPIDGSIDIDGKDLTTMNGRERSRLIALVTTERITVGGLTVTDLVALGRQPHTGFLGRLSQTDRDIVTHSMQLVGISHKANAYTADLSDGERQKAMIARALAQDTPIIILDEPTAFLDIASRIETMQLLHKLSHEQNKAILLSSHDLSQSLLMADDLWLITNDGELINGTTANLLKENALERLFDNPRIKFNPTLLDFQYQE